MSTKMNENNKISDKEKDHHIPNEVKSLILCLVLLLGSSIRIGSFCNNHLQPVLSIFFKYKTNSLHVGPNAHYFAHSCNIWSLDFIAFFAGLRETA